MTPEAIEFRRKAGDAPLEAGARSYCSDVRGGRRRSMPGKCPISCRRRNISAPATGRLRLYRDDLQDRRVEITGPVDRKMVINALNSGAKVFMADFEDSFSPVWSEAIQGHINLRDAINRTISYTSPEGKQYALNEKTAALLVRPRGWHLLEKHVLIDGKAISGGIFDFGAVLLPQRENAARKRNRPLLLPAQAGEPPGGAAVERCLHAWPSRNWASRMARSRPRC